MAEEQEVQSHEDLQNSTLEVMERDLESIHCLLYTYDS